MEPKVTVEQLSARRDIAPQSWRVKWRVRNLGREPLEILAARLPHSKFRGEEQELMPHLKLLANQSADIELAVACGERPGTIVENAFLIFRAFWRERSWRIFCRLTAAFDERGAPRTTAELITAQPVGWHRQ